MITILSFFYLITLHYYKTNLTSQVGKKSDSKINDV